MHYLIKKFLNWYLLRHVDNVTLVLDRVPSAPTPPYVTHWTIENGTATLAEGTARALELATGNRLAVSYASMVGGRVPPAPTPEPWFVNNPFCR